MINSKAVVQLVYEEGAPDYSLTLYMGIKSDTGTEEPQLLESVNDLYRYYNTYNVTPSYSMAEFCLLRGYRVQAQRVNTITGVASCRKFISNSGVSAYFAPRQGKDYGEDSRHFSPYISPEYAVYSQILTFHEPDIIDDNSIIDEDFLMLVPRQVFQANQAFEEVSVISALANWNWNPDSEGQTTDHKDLNSSYTVDSFTTVYLNQNELRYGNFKDTILQFLESNCNMEIEQIEGTDSYLVISTTNISDFTIRSPYIAGQTEELVTVQSSDIGLNDNYCYLYDDYKVATIYSKVPSSIDDTTVDITSSDGYYYVNVYKYLSDGSPALSENFQYSTDPTSARYITNLSVDSNLVEIEIHNSGKDVTGTYNLIGQEELSQDTDFIDSLSGEIGGSDLFIDICVDNNDEERREDYLTKLREVFPTSLILTDYSIDDMTQIVQVGPEVTWLNTGETMRGYTFLLDILPEDSMARETSALKVETSDDSYQNTVTDTDYGVELIGVTTQLNSVFPIKSLLSVLAMENYILSSSITSESEFRELVSTAQITVNDYLLTNTQLEVRYVNVSGRRLTAGLNARVDTFIVYNFKITATLLW